MNNGSIFVPGPFQHTAATSGAVPVVRIVRPDLPGGFLEINEADFDPAKHALYEGPDPDPAPDGRFIFA